ncbi:MAG TPA: tRNA (adenosine(37)-N6)-threonylcarbamoyltransferase complex dimerization subunit type 1 TsaB [Verrucomicrobiales bacterium]|jgi:tRNA threonylcarbamoyladenosine biosynthesis protein TsaB|nr:tRNA (adenosine(37)-N6)-threonylcarbamoyltransferase complex dimerization subunit type 1 TsaB [Verrucomicrobiales bacterium]
MMVLAIEYSTEKRSVALGLDGKILGVLPDESMHRVTPLALIDQLLLSKEVSRSEIRRIVVGIGPGSYTGIRNAISTAQGWQLATDVELLGIGNSLGMARVLSRAGKRGKVHILSDAQQNHFYHAEFRIDDSGDVDPVGSLKISSLQSVQFLVERQEVIAGPGLDRILKCGAVDIHPSAELLLETAEGRKDFASGDQLTPFYLRTTRFVKAPEPTEFIQNLISRFSS